MAKHLPADQWKQRDLEAFEATLQAIRPTKLTPAASRAAMLKAGLAAGVVTVDDEKLSDNVDEWPAAVVTRIAGPVIEAHEAVSKYDPN